MKLKTLLSFGMALGLAGGLLIGGAGDAAAEKVRWKMQSAFGSNLPHIGTLGVTFTEWVEDMSGGDLQIKFFEPGALVPALECFDAASKGSVESCWTTPGYHTGKYPALAFFTAVPFGPSIGEYLAWKWFGGGQELRAEIYDKHNLISFDAGSIGPETSGWFREPVTSLAQLKGLKMRFFGLGAQVVQKLGVSTQLLAAADIYPALERGVIDATEFSMPSMDINLGFYDIAKNNYFPGWHQQVSVQEVLINKGAWDALSKEHQAIVRTAARAMTVHMYAETEWRNPEAMLEMQKKHSVQIKRWNDEQLAAFEQAWREVVEEESAKDPMFKKVADSYFAFREKYRIWGEAQSLKATYLNK